MTTSPQIVEKLKLPPCLLRVQTLYHDMLDHRPSRSRWSMARFKFQIKAQILMPINYHGKIIKTILKSHAEKIIILLFFQYNTKCLEHNKTKQSPYIERL